MDQYAVVTRNFRHSYCNMTEQGVSRILARVTRIVDSIVIERVKYCIATSISCLTRSKIEDFYGNVKWKLEESLRMTLQEAKMHGKETFSLAYNLI